MRDLSYFTEDLESLDLATEITKEQLRRAAAIVSDYSDNLESDHHYEVVAATLVAIASNFAALARNYWTSPTDASRTPLN